MATVITRCVAITLIVALGLTACGDDSTIPQEHAASLPEEPAPFITLICPDQNTALEVPASDSLCVDLPPGVSPVAGDCYIDLSSIFGTEDRVFHTCFGYDIDVLDWESCAIDWTPFPRPPVIQLRALTFPAGSHTLLIEVSTETGTLRFCIQFTIS